MGVRHHARRFGASKYGLSRVFKVLLDLITIRTLQLFARRPLARFSGAAGLAALLAVLAALTLGGDDLVVRTTVTGLFGTLAVFLFFLGMITGSMFQGSD